MIKNKQGGYVELAVALLILAFIIFTFWAFPTYRVWQQELKGKAEFKEAEWSKQIAIEEAKAELESATLKAQSEVERAKGVSQANEIIAEGLKDNAEYLQYLYIQTLSDLETQLIYVPTEAGLPILEANR